MSGLYFFLDGFRLIRKPALRRYFVMPTIINALILLGLLIVGYLNFGNWVSNIVGLFPDWVLTLYWLIWAMLFVVALFSLALFFNFIANIISAPFNALLSVKVEEYLTKKPLTAQVSVWPMLLRAIGREIRKLLYVLPRFAILVLITFIPGVNFVAPILWIIFGAWMMAVQYTDYGADNNNVSFVDLKDRLQQRRFQALLFGLPAYLLLTIPGVNFVLMPIGVAGGTKFWVERLKH